MKTKEFQKLAEQWMPCLPNWSIKGQRGITGDTAVRLATFFNTTAEFWMNLQKTYELRLAEKSLSGKVRKYIQQQRESMVSA